MPLGCSLTYRRPFSVTRPWCCRKSVLQCIPKDRHGLRVSRRHIYPALLKDDIVELTADLAQLKAFRAFVMCHGSIMYVTSQS